MTHDHRPLGSVDRSDRSRDLIGQRCTGRCVIDSRQRQRDGPVAKLFEFGRDVSPNRPPQPETGNEDDVHTTPTVELVPDVLLPELESCG